MRPMRLVAGVAVGVAVVLVVLLGANVTGQLPIEGGPLGPLQTRGEADGFSLVTVADGQPLYTTALAENDWPLEATIVSVTLRGAVPTPSAEVVGAKSYDLLSDGTVLGIQHDLPVAWQTTSAVAGIIVPPRGDAQHRGVAFLIRLDPVATGDNAIYDIVVDYAIGPIRFRSSAMSSVGLAILVCAPAGQPEQFDDLCPPGG